MSAGLGPARWPLGYLGTDCVSWLVRQARWVGGVRAAVRNDFVTWVWLGVRIDRDGLWTDSDCLLNVCTVY